MTAGGLQSKFWKKTTYAFFPYGLIAFDSLQDFKIILIEHGVKSAKKLIKQNPEKFFRVYCN
jgi:hypothetical protein